MKIYLSEKVLNDNLKETFCLFIMCYFGVMLGGIAYILFRIDGYYIHASIFLGVCLISGFLGTWFFIMNRYQAFKLFILNIDKYRRIKRRLDRKNEN